MLGNRINISLPLIASLVALAIGGLVVLWYLFDVAAAVLGPGMGDVQPDSMLASYVAEHEEKMQGFADRVTGRSAFYIPPIRTLPRIATPEPEPIEQNPEPTPYVPPEPEVITYTGPSPLFAIGEEVWFNRPRPGEPMLNLRVGETAHGITLISVTLPSFITVEFREKRFELELLGDTIVYGQTPNENGVLRQSQDTRAKPTPGIVIVTREGEVPFEQEEDDQPALSATDLEQPAASGRPQPIESDIAFDLRIPGESESGDTADDDAPREDDTADQVELPSPAVQSRDEWHGPPIPPALLAMYTAQSGALTNDETGSATLSTADAPVRVPKDQHDSDAEAATEEDENATPGDPESAAEAESSGERTPQQPDPGADDPEIPPE